MSQVKRSLYKPSLLMGVQPWITIFLGMVFLIVLLNAPLMWKIGGSVFIMFLFAGCVYANRQDYLFFTIIFQYLTQQKYYPFVANKSLRRVKKRFYV